MEAQISWGSGGKKTLGFNPGRGNFKVTRHGEFKAILIYGFGLLVGKLGEEPAKKI